MGDNVRGTYRAKGLPKGKTWAETSGLGILRLAVQWLPHESGEFERIRPHLTLLGFVIIVQGNLEGGIFRKVGLIWGIPVDSIRGQLTRSAGGHLDFFRVGDHIVTGMWQYRFGRILISSGTT